MLHESGQSGRKKVFCLSQTKPNKVQLIVRYYSITATSEALKVPFYFVPVNAEFRIKLHQQQPVAFLFFPVHTFLKRRARAIFSEIFSPHQRISPRKTLAVAEKNSHKKANRVIGAHDRNSLNAI